MATEQADTFPKLLRQHVRQRGDEPAIREKRRGIWRTMTWREFADEARAVAAALSERGLTRGDRVGLLGDNRPRFYAAMAAAQWLGAVPVPLYQDATAEELVEPICKAGITHLFAENQEQVDKLLEILPRCPTVRCIVFDKDRGMRHYRQPQLVSYSDLLRLGTQLVQSNRSLLEEECSRGSGEDTAFVFFTAGTMGPPKGVVLTHAALIDRARRLAALEGLTHRDVAIAYLPPAWLGQILFSYVVPMVVGHSVCCPESSDTLLADMREIAPTCFVATPRVLDALLTQISMRMEDSGGLNKVLYKRSIALARRRALGNPRRRLSVGNILVSGPLRDMLGLSRARVAFTTGDVVAPDLFLFFRSLGVNLKQLYGSTEAGFFIATQRNGSVQADSVGQAVDGVELRVAPSREILVRSSGLFSGYLGEPQATSDVLDPDGWLRTGDAGYVGPDGQIRIVDYVKNIGALSDGSTFSPKVIENRLKFIPYVKDAIVVGNGRDKVCALIDMDGAVVGRWADKRFISYTGHADLASRDEVYDLIAGAIGNLNGRLDEDPELAGSQIHRFTIVHGEFSADDGLLTRTGKLRRHVFAERFRALIDAMYAGRTEATIVVDEGNAPDVQLKIRDAKVSTQARARRAA